MVNTVHPVPHSCLIHCSDVDSSFLSISDSVFFLAFVSCISLGYFSHCHISAKTQKDYKWPHMFLSVSNGWNWSSGIQMRLLRKTRWMGVLVPLTKSSRHTGLNSRCCLGCHILAVIPLQCPVRLCVCDRRGDHEWEPPGTENNGSK